MGNSAPPCLPNACSHQSLATLHLLLPTILATILACSSVSTLSVFVLTTNEVEYKIGAQNYMSSAQDALRSDEYAYPAPDTWSEEIRDVPLWLLFHLILFVLIATYIAWILVLYALEPPPKIDGFTGTKGIKFAVPRTFAIILAGLVIALASKDAAFWSSGASVADFRPDAIGYFVVIVGISFGSAWLYILLASLGYKPPRGYKSSRSRHHSSSQSRSGASRSRSYR